MLRDLKHKTVFKPPKGWKEDARKHYRAEKRRLEEARGNGATGRLEFEGWY